MKIHSRDRAAHWRVEQALRVRLNGNWARYARR